MAAKSSDQFEYRIDYTSEKSLNNWIQKYDMTCAPKSEFGIFGMLYFSGTIIGSLLFPRLSDIYGRKPFVIGLLLLQVAASFTVLASDNL